MPATAEERTMRAQIAAEASWAATVDRTARTAPAAMAAKLLQFESEIDPDGALDPAERTRRAQHLQRAHLMRLRLKVAKGRRIAAEATAAADAAELELADLGATL